MEIGVVTRSERALKRLAAEHGFDPNDVYIISSKSDLLFMKRELAYQDYMILMADDAGETGIKDSDISDDVKIYPMGVKFE